MSVLVASEIVGVGPSFATDEDGVTQVNWPKGKLAFGADGTRTDVSLTSGLPTQPQTGSTWAISAVSLPLPANAAKETGGNLAVMAGAVSGGAFVISGTVAVSNFPSGFLAAQSGSWTVGVTGSVAVTGTFWQATQPISGTITANAGSGTFAISAVSLPLPTGASTAAKQPALGTAGSASSDVLTVQGIASMTALKVDGSGVTQPVSGTVTANAGTNLNTSTLALESGGNLAALAGTVSAGKVTVAGTVTANAGTGTFAIAAASLPLPTGASTSAKQPALGTAGSASADVITIQGITSMTALKVDGSGVTQPVSGTFWQATQPVSGTVTANAGTNLNTSTLALESGGNLATIAGAISSSKVQSNIAQMNGVTVTMGNGVSGTGVQRVTLASDSTGQVAIAAGSASIGTIQPGNTPNTAPWLVQTAPAVSGGLTIHRLLSASGTNATAVKASPGMIYGLYVINTGTTVAFMKIYNATSVTPGSGTPVMTLTIPPAASAGLIGGFSIQQPLGIAFSTGISYDLTGVLADNDSTSVGAGQVVVNMLYD